MMLRALNLPFRGEVMTLIVCVVLSLTMLFLPIDTRIVVADHLGMVLTDPYWDLRNYGEDVFRIREENAQLKLELTTGELLIGTIDRMQSDAERMVGPAIDPGYVGELVPCRVVMRQRSRFATMIKVRSSVPVNWRPWQPVILRLGYLGRIRTVINEREAWVELLSAPNFALGVELERTGLLGILRPRGNRYVIEMVGRDEDVQVGDRVITSGIAEVRDRSLNDEEVVRTPRGFPVGVVTAASAPFDKIFKEIVVAPAATFNHNETVFVVTSPDIGGQR